METINSESAITLTLTLVSCFSFILSLSATSAGKIEPAGTNIGAVQFDAVIELNRYSPHSLRHDYTMIFARYWVARDYYSASVVWAEPQSTDLFFAIHPMGLSVFSNEQAFKVCHESIKKDNETYKKPLGQRGVFRYMFGGYPISNIRFAEREALAERLYATDIKFSEDANKADEEVLDFSIAATEGVDARVVSKLKIQTNGDRIDSMQLFNSDKRLLKDIIYEYENKGNKSYLHMQTIVLPERPVTVGFKGEGVKVTLDGKEYRYRYLEATHNAGGRRCTVEYELVTLVDKRIPIPVRVTVRGGQENRILRSVHLMNFKKVQLDAVGAEDAARQFATVPADERQYEQLHLKYWKKAPDEIEGKDHEAIEQLRDRFQTDLNAPDKTTGEKLKDLNILMELNRILGKTTELERHYRWYLSILAEKKLLWMTLVGGYGVIETSMFRGRRSEAEKLLDLWLNAALEINDAESILLFSKSQLAKNRLWTTVKLLENFLNKNHCSADDRFEAQVLRCIALGELCNLVSTDDIAKKGLIAEVQANWVASIGKNDLDRMLANSIDKAGQSFISLPKPA